LNYSLFEDEIRLLEKLNDPGRIAEMAFTSICYPNKKRLPRSIEAAS